MKAPAAGSSDLCRAPCRRNGLHGSQDRISPALSEPLHLLNTQSYVGDTAQILAGSVSVDAKAENTSLTSTAALPNTTVTAVGGKAVDAQATVHNASTKAFTQLGTGIITDTGDVTVNASSVTKLTAGASKGKATGISLAAVNSYHFLIEVLNHSTEAGIGGHVDSNGNVSATATDSVSGSVSLNSTSIGVFTGDESTAIAKVNNQKPLEKEMATHSSVLAWRIPGTGEPGGLPSVGSHRVGHD